MAAGFVQNAAVQCTEKNLYSLARKYAAKFYADLKSNYRALSRAAPQQTLINDGDYMTDEKTQQPLGVASDLNAELGLTPNIEIKYSEEQQKMIDDAEKQLLEYDEFFISSLRKKQEPQENIRNLLLSDNTRNLLVKRIVSLRSVMIPQYLIKT